MQAQSKLIVDYKKSKPFKYRTGKALFVGDSLSKTLEHNGFNVSRVTKIQKALEDNYLRTFLLFIAFWGFVSSVTAGFLLLESDSFPFWLPILLASPANMFLVMCPDVLLTGESFLYHWKAKRLSKLYLGLYGLKLNRFNLMKNEGEIFYGLMDMFNDLDKKFKIEVLYGDSPYELWDTWRLNLNRWPTGWLKLGVYLNNRYLGKHFTECSINDLSDVLSKGYNFQGRLSSLMVNRKASISELKKLVEEYFFMALLAEEVLRYEDYREREKNSVGMTIYA